jgi:DNA-binding protein H-NS
MKKTYEQVLQQIETLQAQAEEMRRTEVAGVIERMRGAIKHYNLTAADLGLAGASARGSVAAKPSQRKGNKKGAAKAAAVVKYRNDSGGTWGGIGKRPQWLRDALAGGKNLQDFLVK